MFNNNSEGKRTILVTGGNRGIGLAIVSALAQNGADTVLLGSRNLADGQREADSLSANVQAVELDLGSLQTAQAHITAIQNTFGRVDVLVNNAAVLYDRRFLDQLAGTSDGTGVGKIGTGNSTLDSAFQVNVFAPILLSQAVLPDMLAAGYGRIVNVSSGWGAISDGLTGPFSYSLTKAALNAATLCIAKEVHGNVKVNALCPGWVRTRMGGMGADRSPAKGAETAVWLANIDSRGPNGKFFRDKKQIPW